MKKKSILLLSGVLFTFAAFAQNPINPGDHPAINGARSFNMLPKEAHNPDREWSYTPKQTTVIGVPFTPVPVQVTFDGSIYTREGELFFLYGKNNTPLNATQKTFFKGWIPIVKYDWKDSGIDYNVEMFGQSLQGEGAENSIQFVKITMKNNTDKEQEAFFSTATRASGIDHRMGDPKFSENSKYEFVENDFLRDGKIVYTFEGKPSKYAVKGEAYSVPFIGKDKGVAQNSAVGITSYNQKLAPGKSTVLTFKFPRVPIDKADKTFAAKYKKAAYEKYRAECEKYWTDLIEVNGGTVSVPETRVADSYKAGLVHLMLATRTHGDGKPRQGSGLPYDGIFFNDFIDMRLAYDIAGLPSFVELNFPWMCSSINDEGLFVDSNVSHSKEIMTSHGQALYSLCNHFRYVDNKELAQGMFDAISKAVRLIYNDHHKYENGLVRPSTPFDAEMIIGHYTSHNLWCLLGLRSAITYADYLGKEKEAKEWRELEKTYSQAIVKAIEQSAHLDGYVPTGLYSFKKGIETGWKEFRTNQDWENMLLVYPTETLKPCDPKVAGTLQHLRKNKYREGVTTYRNGMHLHQYATTNLTNQYIAINDQEKALLDMYHILLHNGSTHEGFENFIDPWSDRDPEPIPAPHAWAAAKTALLIRNSQIREYGGNAGIEMPNRSLYLFSVVSPSWVIPGEKININNARTEFGVLDASMTFTEKGADVMINSSAFKFTPKNIYIAVPYHKDLVKAVSDKGDVKVDNGYMVLDPSVSEVTIEWKDNKVTDKNYTHSILESYRKEPGIGWIDCTAEQAKLSPKEKLDTDCDMLVVPAPDEGFILDSEKGLAVQPLSFEVVKDAYLLEYDRRRGQFIKAGKKLLEIKAPEFK